MAAAFDPYYTWLGIPPAEQPATHYRLLGIARFEPDPQVIENAALQRVSFVRTFQTGKYSEQSQQVLNQLSAARVCLLDAAKKAAYDEELRGGAKQAAVIPPEGKAPPAAPVANLTSSAVSELPPQRPFFLAAPVEPSASSSTGLAPALWIAVPLVAVGGLAFLGAVAAVLWYVQTRNNPVVSLPLDPPPVFAPSPIVVEPPAKIEEEGTSAKPERENPDINTSAPTADPFAAPLPAPSPAPAPPSDLPPPKRVRPPQPPPDPSAPHIVRNEPAKFVGQDVFWTGILSRLCRYRGEVHLLFTPDRGGGMVEAVAEGAFYDQLADYFDSIADGNPDRIVVAGTVALPSDEKFRLSTEPFLLRLKTTERQGILTSKAEVGQTRAAGNFDRRRSHSELALLYRDLPGPEESRSISAEYSRFTSGKAVVLRLKQATFATLEIQFPQAKSLDFVDYEGMVTAKMRLEDPDQNLAIHTLKWKGESIQRQDVPDSLITVEGRKKPYVSHQAEYDRFRAATEADAQKGVEFTLAGAFQGLTTDRGLPALRIDRLRLDRIAVGEVKILVLGDPAEEALLAKLKPGEEIRIGLRLLPGPAGMKRPALRWVEQATDGNVLTLLRDKPSKRSPKEEWDAPEFRKRIAGDWEMVCGDRGQYTVKMQFDSRLHFQWFDGGRRTATLRDYKLDPQQRIVTVGDDIQITWLEPRFMLCTGNFDLQNKAVRPLGILRRVE